MRISDDQMMAAVAELTDTSFTVLAVRPDGENEMRVRFQISGATGTFAIRLPLPSSTELKPWLQHIPENADHAAAMLAEFMEEEAATGAEHWAVTTFDGVDRLFVLQPYGFRVADPRRHRQLSRSAGRNGWWGRVDENDDPADTPGARRWARLEVASLTYPEIGATVGALPPGYRHTLAERHVGTGADRFEVVAERLLSWDMHRFAGLLVTTWSPVVVVGAVAEIQILLGFGTWQVPIGGPVRVLEVIDEPRCRGFSYGTLPGHPENGEERFLVHHDPDDTVRAEIRAFSRPGRWFTRLAGPLARHLQDRTTQRYLDALARSRSGSSLPLA